MIFSGIVISNVVIELVNPIYRTHSGVNNIHLILHIICRFCACQSQHINTQNTKITEDGTDMSHK